MATTRAARRRRRRRRRRRGARAARWWWAPSCARAPSSTTTCRTIRARGVACSPPSLALQLIASWPELAVRDVFAVLLLLLYDLEENQLMKFVLALKSTQFLTGLYFALSGYFLFWPAMSSTSRASSGARGRASATRQCATSCRSLGCRRWSIWRSCCCRIGAVRRAAGDAGARREGERDAAAAAAAAAKAAAADAADAAADAAAADGADGAAADGAATAGRASLAAAHDLGVLGAPLAVADRGCRRRRRVPRRSRRRRPRERRHRRGPPRSPPSPGRGGRPRVRAPCRYGRGDARPAAGGGDDGGGDSGYGGWRRAAELVEACVSVAGGGSGRSSRRIDHHLLMWDLRCFARRRPCSSLVASLAIRRAFEQRTVDAAAAVGALSRRRRHPHRRRRLAADRRRRRPPCSERRRRRRSAAGSVCAASDSWYAWRSSGWRWRSRWGWRRRLLVTDTFNQGGGAGHLPALLQVSLRALGLPFMVFEIPGLDTLISHTRPPATMRTASASPRTTTASRRTPTGSQAACARGRAGRCRPSTSGLTEAVDGARAYLRKHPDASRKRTLRRRDEPRGFSVACAADAPAVRKVLPRSRPVASGSRRD